MFSECCHITLTYLCLSCYRPSSSDCICSTCIQQRKSHVPYYIPCCAHRATGRNEHGWSGQGLDTPVLSTQESPKLYKHTNRPHLCAHWWRGLGELRRTIGGKTGEGRHSTRLKRPCYWAPLGYKCHQHDYLNLEIQQSEGTDDEEETGKN